MPVYVDDARIAWRGKRWSHLTADTLRELHAFAARLGLKREWFQPGSRPVAAHYDVTEPKRERALELGAVAETVMAGARRRRDGAAPVTFTDAELDPRRTTRAATDPLRDREDSLVRGDELYVDVSAYLHGGGWQWCTFLFSSTGSASVYPYKVQIPDRGGGQYKASEILGWRRPVRVHRALAEAAAYEASLV